MKYAHYDEINGKLLGWYDLDIHSSIPTPNVEVTDEEWKSALDKGANCIENGVPIIKDFRTPEDVKADKLKSFELAIKSHLDDEAKAKGYESILSVCTYAGYTNPYQLEGQSFIQWRGLVWEYYYTELAKIEAGSRTEPSIEEFILELPVYIAL